MWLMALSLHTLPRSFLGSQECVTLIHSQPIIYLLGPLGTPPAEMSRFLFCKIHCQTLHAAPWGLSDITIIHPTPGTNRRIKDSISTQSKKAWAVCHYQSLTPLLQQAVRVLILLRCKNVTLNPSLKNDRGFKRRNKKIP